MNNQLITFNTWKHHLGFVRSRINYYTENMNLYALTKEMLIVGDSLMDVYYGELNEKQVVNEVMYYLSKNDLCSHREYLGYLEKHIGKYSIITLTDSSKWVLREADSQTKFVHLHPAKYSPYSLGVRSMTLKTSVLATCYSRIENCKIDTGIINNLRKEFLNECPIKSLKTSAGLEKLIALLS